MREGRVWKANPNYGNWYWGLMVWRSWKVVTTFDACFSFWHSNIIQFLENKRKRRNGTREQSWISLMAEKYLHALILLNSEALLFR